MLEILKLPQFVKDHHVAESQVRTCGIDPQLYSERLALLETFGQLFLSDKGLGPPLYLFD